MIHTNLKKRYTPPQIEVTMSEIEDELLEGSVTGYVPGQDHGDNEDDDDFGNNSKAVYFGFDNFADYYDNDDYYEF